MKNYIQQIIELFANNDYLPNTKKEIQEWIAKEEHIEEKEKALHLLWKQAGEQKIACGMQQSIQRMQRNIGMRTTDTNKIYELRIWRGIAVALLAVSTLSLFVMLDKERIQKDLVECYVPIAEISEFTLPDGTHVMLNSKSTLLYPNKFVGETRSVYLIGEANFKVKPDKKHPFIVKANDCQIIALGTEFNVNTYPENDELVATLLEGSVKIEFNNLVSNITLKPNEQFIYNKQTKSHSLHFPQIEDVTAWQRGELVFGNMCLEDIFINLERNFPYKFVYGLHSLSENTYTFRFQKQASLEEVMKIMTQVVGEVEYTIQGNKCYIMNK